MDAPAFSTCVSLANGELFAPDFAIGDGGTLPDEICELANLTRHLRKLPTQVSTTAASIA